MISIHKNHYSTLISNKYSSFTHNKKFQHKKDPPNTKLKKVLFFSFLFFPKSLFSLYEILLVGMSFFLESTTVHRNFSFFFFFFIKKSVFSSGLQLFNHGFLLGWGLNFHWRRFIFMVVVVFLSLISCLPENRADIWYIRIEKLIEIYNSA